MERAVLYAAVPCFYAAIERARRPELRARPLLVGGDPRKRGVVQSASSDARAEGVEDGMTILEALKRCPRARPLRTDMKYYREVSGLLRTSLRAEADNLEAAGLDGAYLEVSRPVDDPRAVAERLCARVREDLRLPLRVGVASAKFLAKIAADRIPHDGIEVVPSGDEGAYLGPLPVDVLPGVGPRTVSTLGKLGAYRVADLRDVAPAVVEAELGNHGLRILELAEGKDSAAVRGSGVPRTLSQEQSFDAPQIDLGVLGEVLSRLAVGLEGVLRRQGLGAKRVALKVRFEDGEVVTRSQTLEQRVDRAAALREAADPLLLRTQAGARPIRTLGLQLSQLGAAEAPRDQLDLFAATGAEAPPTGRKEE